jgi:hypothetical protein
MPGELACADAAEPAVSAGDDGCAAVLIRDFFGGPLSCHWFVAKVVVRD